MQTVTLPARIRKVGGERHATCSGFERIGTTSPIARQAITQAIGRQLCNTFTRCYRWAADGTMFTLFYADGWKYEIMGASHAERGYPCTCTAGPIDASYDEALAAMEQHATRYAAPVSKRFPVEAA